MERPSWAPVVLSGVLPRELPDFLAMLILGLASAEVVFSQLQTAGLALRAWALLLMVPPVCTLAALSNSPRRQREELALFAYGGSGWQIQLRYFVRGAISCAIGVSPLLVGPLATAWVLSLPRIALFGGILLTGGAFYAGPSLLRTRSLEFAGHYKG